MNKKQTTITILNCLICAITLMSVFLTTNKNPAQAYQQPAQFLGPVYYGEETTLQVFDHNLPLISSDDGNSDTMHYDGVTYPDGTSYYGYDQHLGVDYNLKYEPVLAAADGTVAFAGWSDPGNHRKLYGLHVRMKQVASSWRVYGLHFTSCSPS